jgi:hypothetical protein
MQNSLERPIKFNLDNFNKNFEKELNSDSDDYLDNYDVNNRFTKPFGIDDKIEDNNIINLSLGNIVLELREMFFVILELISKKTNPTGYVFSSPKRKYIFGIFLIVFGCLLLLLSTLMMEKNVL